MTTLASAEQLLLEMINRARMDPNGEAAIMSGQLNRSFDINEGLAAGTISSASKQVLAGNNVLANVAESHSTVMLTSKVFEDAPASQRNPHEQIGDAKPQDRIANAGYVETYPPGQFYHLENVAWQGTSGAINFTTMNTAIHRDLFVDTMDSARAHRLAIMDDNMREIGIGEITGPVKPFGFAAPFNGALVTENFGVSGSQSFLTGVVYNDTKVVDDFYSLDEGVAGVKATVTTTGGAAVGSDTTGAGGGWSVGEPGGTYNVTFSGGGLAAAVTATVEAGNRNAKVDLVNGNEIFANMNTTLGSGAKELHLIGMDNINGTGNSLANVIIGNKGANILNGGGGSDTVDGAAGDDTAVFTGALSQYQITVQSGTSVIVKDLRSGTPDGTDTVANVEHFRFADQTVNFGDLRTTPVAVAGSVAISDVTIIEGNAGTKIMTFTVTRSNGTAAFDVNFATSNAASDTAKASDGDFIATSGSLHFDADINTRTIAVTINGDTKVEGNETFNVNLSGATNGATISKSQGVGIISNDDVAPVAGSVAISDVTIIEGNAGTKIMTFTVTRSNGTAAFDVNFATSNAAGDTAKVSDGDFVAASGSLHFDANVNTRTIAVTINGDTKVEGNETFNVNLSGATNGATISKSQGVGTISNDDVAPAAGSVAISDVTIIEGNSGTKIMTFTVTRSNGTAAFDVNFATSNAAGDTAKVSDGDFVATSGSLHFDAGINTRTISVTINGDTKVEGNETFNVNLSGATNGATISKSQGVGIISNDDVAATNHVPVVTGQNMSVGANGSVAASTMFTAHDQEGDGTITQYAFWDSGSGGGHFAVNGVTQASGQWIYVNAGNLGTINYIGGSATGGETVYVSAYDGKGWSANGSLTATTVAAASEDFNGDGKSDILWHNNNGSVAMWQMNGSQIASQQTFGTIGTTWHAAATEDFNGDGKSDILWHNDSGSVALWQMNGTQITSNQVIGSVGTNWHVAAADDFNGDGKADILWKSDSGGVAMWQMDGSKIAANLGVGTVAAGWQIAGTADLNGDGKSDILLRSDSGAVAVWQMDGKNIVANQSVGTIGTAWHFAGADDFNGDGKDDIIWRNDNGSVTMWQMNGNQIASNEVVGSTGTAWHIADTGDYNKDGDADILWQSDTGAVAMWQMDGSHILANQGVGTMSTDWHLF